MNKKKQYMAPVIRCVEFKVEKGVASSSLYQGMDTRPLDMTDNQYNENNFDPFRVIRKWNNEDWD